MIPPSTPSAPQRGQENQHVPEDGDSPETVLNSVAPFGPENGAAAEKPVRKQVVKPALPEFRPKPPSRSSRSLPRLTPLPWLTPLRSLQQLAAQRRPAPHRRDSEPSAAFPAEGGHSAAEPVKDPLPGARTEVPAGLIRRTAVTAATAAAVGCTLFAVFAGSGLQGIGLAVAGPADNTMAGFSPQAVLGPAGSLLAPAAVLWWIWLPIVAGWLAYAVYQWLPQQRVNPRQNWFGWFVLAAEIAALGWLLSVSAGTAAGVLTVAAAQTALGLLGVHRSNADPAATTAEGLLTDVPFGLFLAAGIFSLATSLGFILTTSNADLAGWGGAAWALIGLVTVALGVTVVCMTDRGHLALALAAVWGLACVAVERLTGVPESIGVGAAAAGSAFLVLVSAGSRRHQIDHERRRIERRSLREQPSVELPSPGDVADPSSRTGA